MLVLIMYLVAKMNNNPETTQENKVYFRRKFPILRRMVNEGLLDPEKVRNDEFINSTSDFTQVLKYLIENNIISEEKVRDFFVNSLGSEPFNKMTETVHVEKTISEIISKSFMENKMFFPLSYKNGILEIVALNPYDKDIVQQLKFLGIENIKIKVGLYSEIKEILHTEAETVSEFESLLEDVDESQIEEEQISLDEEINIHSALIEAEEAPIVKASRIIILNGVRKGASDIHIEPFEKEVRIRYRIDGILRTYQKLPASTKDAIVARFKIMSNLDIAEKRLPQDGRIRVKIDGKPIDLRISTLPTVHGEKVVMRIQNSENYLNLKLEDLGFEKENLEKVRKAIYSPWGMILVTGPTGSGKTTTLYTVLMERNEDDVNIATAEDPVEVAINGINQVQVRENIGFTFAEALRSFLRQDPDIILVGEIRDTETAEIAVKAALTGHLVFSTLHTNDAPSSITRLHNMGVEKFLIGTAVNLIIAQRLIRKLCPKCKKPSTFPEEFWLKLGLTEEQIEKGQFYMHNPLGCEHCNHTGYKGRVAVHEILEVNEDIRKALLKNASEDELREIFLKNGGKTLFEDALVKISKGITDYAEVERALKQD